MKIKYLILYILFCFTSCKEDIQVLKQKIYFEKHYENYAWLPQTSGYLIDSLGNVMQFHWLEVSHIWYDSDSAGYVSNANMDKNISFCQSISFRINTDTLKFYVSKIVAASKGTVLKPQYVMADAGTTTFSAFIFDKKTNQYKQVLIKTTGDMLTINESPEAEQIYRWMNKIGQ
jgi:hypothetical protein